MKLLRMATILPLLILAPEIEAASRKSNRCYVRFEPISADSNDTSRRRRFRRRFTAQNMLDLRVDVWLRADNDAGLVEVKLYTPAGHLYEVLQATADPEVVQRSSRRRRSRVVSARLPVAGSHITSRSLYGKWSAEVFLDGNDRPCSRRPRRFFIEP